MSQLGLFDIDNRLQAWILRKSDITLSINGMTSTGTEIYAVGGWGAILSSPEVSSANIVVRHSPQTGFSIHLSNSSLYATLPKTVLGKNIRVAIYGVRGERVYDKSVDAASKDIILPIAGFTKGRYFLAVTGAGQKILTSFSVLP